MTLNPDQIKLYERAGELSRQFQELLKLQNDEPGPDRPWFFHPLGYWIDLGYSGQPPEYDPPPPGRISPRAATFAQQMGMLARTPKAWLDEKVMDIARQQLPPHLEIESLRLTEKEMKDFPVPGKLSQKDSLAKELEWRQQWKVYNDFFASVRTDHRIRLLLKWFREDFFEWVSEPKCVACKGDALHVGKSPPNEEERRYTARDVELWRCSRCNHVERFPRYNDPVKLLSSRRGRCGEFANCFALLVRATGAATRWVWNAEDHAWVEYFSTRHRRWIHLDPCETAFDDPLIYARNWKKKMSYCIAFDEFGAMDVTNRYVRRPQEEGLPRTAISECNLKLVLQVLRNFRRNSLPMVRIRELERRDQGEMKELLKFIEDDALSRAAPAETGTIGRETGTAEWKAARGEDGTEH